MAVEKQKPDIERERGYQERDIARFEQSMKAVNRRYDAKIDQEIIVAMLTHYVALPKAERVSSIDKFFDLNKTTVANFNEKKLHKKLSKMYKKTKLNSQEQRLTWMSLVKNSN